MVMYCHFGGKLFKKSLILLPKSNIFIKDCFCSIRGCYLLRHPSTEQRPLLKSSEKFEGQGDCNSEWVVVLFDISSSTIRRYG